MQIMPDQLQEFAQIGEFLEKLPNLAWQIIQNGTFWEIISVMISLYAVHLSRKQTKNGTAASQKSQLPASSLIVSPRQKAPFNIKKPDLSMSSFLLPTLHQKKMALVI